MTELRRVGILGAAVLVATGVTFTEFRGLDFFAGISAIGGMEGSEATLDPDFVRSFNRSPLLVLECVDDIEGAGEEARLLFLECSDIVGDVEVPRSFNFSSLLFRECSEMEGEVEVPRSFFLSSLLFRECSEMEGEEEALRLFIAFFGSSESKGAGGGLAMECRNLFFSEFDGDFLSSIMEARILRSETDGDLVMDSIMELRNNFLLDVAGGENKMDGLSPFLIDGKFAGSRTRLRRNS